MVYVGLTQNKSSLQWRNMFSDPTTRVTVLFLQYTKQKTWQWFAIFTSENKRSKTFSEHTRGAFTIEFIYRHVAYTFLIYKHDCDQSVHVWHFQHPHKMSTFLLTITVHCLDELIVFSLIPRQDEKKNIFTFIQDNSGMYVYIWFCIHMLVEFYLRSTFQKYEMFLPVKMCFVIFTLIISAVI